MSLLSLTYLVTSISYSYIELSNKMALNRYETLMESPSMEPGKSVTNTWYYTLVDINALCVRERGEEVAPKRKGT